MTDLHEPTPSGALPHPTAGEPGRYAPSPTTTPLPTGSVSTLYRNSQEVTAGRRITFQAEAVVPIDADNDTLQRAARTAVRLGQALGAAVDDEMAEVVAETRRLLRRRDGLRRWLSSEFKVPAGDAEEALRKLGLRSPRTEAQFDEVLARLKRLRPGSLPSDWQWGPVKVMPTNTRMPAPRPVPDRRTNGRPSAQAVPVAASTHDSPAPILTLEAARAVVVPPDLPGSPLQVAGTTLGAIADTKDTRLLAILADLPEDTGSGRTIQAAAQLLFHELTDRKLA